MRALMNWAIALPEIVLSLVAMAILMFGVLRRGGQLLPVQHARPRRLPAGRVLVLTSSRGIGYHGQFVADAFTSFVKMLVLAGAALALMLSLDYNRKNRHRAVRVSRADAALGRRHDGDGIGHEPDDAVSRAGTAIAGALRAGRLRARRCCARPRRG